MTASRESSARPGIRRPSAKPASGPPPPVFRCGRSRLLPELAWLGSAQAAAKSSDRRLQIFLTAPAVPLPGWLPVDALRSSGPSATPASSARGSSPASGVLEEAGGILAADGTRERRGAGDANPDRPEYCFVQRVDFCSPPLLATRRDLFERLGGFDQGAKAPDDALVDFSLRAGQAGAPVYYQPQARVVAIGNGDR